MQSQFEPWTRRGKNRWRLALGPLAGLLVGAAMAATAPPSYAAEISLHFPGTDVKLFRKLLETLQPESVDHSTLSQVGEAPEDGRTVEVAAAIFETRAGAHYALEHAHWALDESQLERYRKRNIRVQVRPGAILDVQVTAPRPDTARAVCQGLIEYYTDFTKTRSLSNTQRVREALEERYLRTAAQVRTLEARVGKSEQRSTRKLGDSLIQPGLAMQEQLEQRRSAEDRASQTVLDRLRILRQELPDNNLPGELATAETSKPAPDRYRGLEAPRPADIRGRLKLERNYEDSTALHRLLLQQHAVLRLLEDLESQRFEILDPLAVRPEAPERRWATFCGVGLLLGLGISGLLLLAQTMLAGDENLKD